MTTRYLLWIGVALAGASTLPAAGPQASNAQAGSPYSAVVGRYCLPCHNEKLKTADLILSKVDASNPSADPQVWEKVAHKLRACHASCGCSPAR